MNENENKEEYFLVTVLEHLSRTVKVKANSLKEACDKVDTAYKNCDIILDADDYADGETIGRSVTEEDLSLYEEVE